MSTPTQSDREKFSEKLLKEWENIGDEVLIREVATKGKYINFLHQFLAKRSNKSIGDIKHYFNAEIDKYVHRLLSNRQVHKAALVLRNVGRQSQIIFYEFVQTTSKEHIDDDIKDHILEYLQTSIDNFDAVRDEYDYNLLVLRLAASNKTLHRQFEGDIHVFTLEALYRKNIEFHKLMAVMTCLHCKNAVLVEKLDKHTTWNHLWQTEQIQYICIWLNELYLINSKTIGTIEVDAATTKETCFDVALKHLFSSWDIEEAMFAAVQNHPKMNEFLVLNFARLGLIVDSEKSSIVTIFKRIFATNSFALNEKWLMTEDNLEKLLRIVLEQNELELLAFDYPFTIELVEKVSSDFPQMKNDIDLCLAIRKCDFKNAQSIAEISEKCSKYIIETTDKDFYKKQPYVYLLEKLLKDESPLELAVCEEAIPIVGKIPYIDAFFKKLRETQTIDDYDVTLADLLKLINIDLSIIINDAFPPNTDTSNDNNELISFDNETLIKKYGQPTKLTYVDFVKQHRSAYAVYKFFIDQLKNYSQISKAQIQIAGGVITELAINNMDDTELVAHCVAFIEMLGIDSQVLRAYLMCCRTIKEHFGDKFNLGDCINENRVIEQMEQIFLENIRNSTTLDDLMDTHKYEPLRILCRAKKMDLPISFLEEVAARTDWFRFLLFTAYHDYSIRAIINVCQMDCFPNRNVGLNIGRALKETIVGEEMPSAKRTNSFSYREHKRKMQNKIETSQLVWKKSFLNKI